jgi:hypothetical protein
MQDPDYLKDDSNVEEMVLNRAGYKEKRGVELWIGNATYDLCCFHTLPKKMAHCLKS